MTGDVTMIGLEREGMLKLYAVNGRSRTELASIRTGMLSDEDALNVGAALRDLVAVVDGLQVRPADAFRSLPRPSLPAAGVRAVGPSLAKREHAAAGVPRAKLYAKAAQRTADVLASIRASGTTGMSKHELMAALGLAPHSVANSCKALRAQGLVRFVGSPMGGRWFATDG